MNKDKRHTNASSKNVSLFVKIGFEWDWQRPITGHSFISEHILLCYINFLTKADIGVYDIKSLEKNMCTLNKIHSFYRFSSVSFPSLCLSSNFLYTVK